MSVSSRVLPVAAATLLAASSLLAVAAPSQAATKSSKPAVVTLAAVVTNDSATATYAINRTANQIRTQTCTLDGIPTACDTTADSSTRKPALTTYAVTFDSLANGEHTFIVSFRLTDGGTVTESALFTVDDTPACAKNTQAGSVASGDLQAVINAATAGDTIEITGTCSGSFAISKDLTLRGVGTAATLDGNGVGPLPVVDINTSAVTLDNLTITGGAANIFGGGIANGVTRARTTRAAPAGRGSRPRWPARRRRSLTTTFRRRL